MIKEKFKEWLFSEPERRQKYVEYYNETFNNKEGGVIGIIEIPGLDIRYA